MDLNKASMVIALTLFLTSVSFNIRPTIVQAQPPIMSTFKVEPSTSTGGVGETITLAVNVYDAQGLWGWQVYMTWDPTVLGFTALTFGDFLAGQSQGTAQYSMTDYASDGWFMCSEVSYGGDPGVTADSGWLMSVDFEVLASGKTTIDIDSEYTYWQTSTLVTWGDDPEEMIKENGYFSACATITYDAGNNIITVIGGTQESPVDFEDIWDADQANGWNVVHNNNNTDTQFEFDARIVLGNGTVAGTTWFADVEKEIFFSHNALPSGVSSTRAIEALAYVHLRFGVLDDATNKETSRGCSIFANSYYPQTWYFSLIYAKFAEACYFYSSTFRNLESAYYPHAYTGDANVYVGTGSKIYNCIFDNAMLAGRELDVNNCHFSNAYYGLSYPATGTFDDLEIWNTYYGIYAVSYYTFEITNAKLKDNIYDFRLYNLGTRHCKAINVEADWTITWTGTSTYGLLRQYTFDLTVTYPNGTAIENANVTITHYGQAETEDYNGLTDSNGQIPQQTLSKGFYDQTGGDTIYSYEPYNLQIANVTGYNDYDGNFTLSEQTDWTITLTPATSESGGATYFAPAFPLAFIICLVLGIVWIKKLADTKPKEIQVMPK